jgi:hypothetical protein
VSYITPRFVSALALALFIAPASLAETPETSLADLDSKLQAQTGAMVEAIIEREMTSLSAQSDALLARAIERRVDSQLAAATDEAQQVALGKAAQANTPARVADVRMKSGSLDVPQGVDAGRHHFDEPFRATPKIAVGVRGGEASNLRVVSVDRAGFDYEIRVRESSVPSDLTADWVALAGGKKSPASMR